MRRNVVGPACALVLWAVGGCSFHAAEVPGDGVGPDTVTVGFTTDSSLEDEMSGAIHVTVALSAPADTAVSVNYSVDGISATAGDDFTAVDGTLTFAPGETSKTIDDIAILTDNQEEGDETFAIKLSGATGAVLGTSTHTVTINANVLPRVQLAMATSQAAENAVTTFTVNLSAPSPTPVVVPYTIGGGTATTADYQAAASGTVTFPANDTTPQVISLDVVNDLLDEDDETVTVTLGQVPNAVVGAIASQTHTILDDDALPVVAFTTASQVMTEGNAGATTAITATISVTPVSGRDVTVMLAPTGTATLNTDYTFTATSVTIPAGQTTGTATVTVAGDTTDEPNETVVLTLSVPATDPHATLGAVATHTITINDDDLVCYGTGTGAVCLDTPPTGAVTLPATIDTTPSANGPCLAMQPSGWVAGGQPAACFIAGNTITMAGTTNVSGSRPLVLVAATTITINQMLDVASHNGGKVGPYAAQTTCTFPAPFPGTANGAGGGAGGSFTTVGGAGATGNATTAGGGAAAAAVGAPTVLRAGCGGEAGGNNASGSQASPGGDAGGVVYLVAGTQITIAASGTINASGAGAPQGAHIYVGGSGGGSGGMIKLYAPAITSAGTLVANGGGGSQGGDNNAFGSAGFDPSPTMPTAPAAGGSASNAGGNGGAGFAGSTGATAGMAGGSANAGGGGGGGGGFVEANVALGGTISAGLLKAP